MTFSPEASSADSAPALRPPAITIEAGYRAGAFGRCTEMHARYYARQAGFGAQFEALVASDLAEFSARLHRPCNQMWLALQTGRIVGTVAIDGEDLGQSIAHLRWFIVDEGLRGGGTGRRLLSAAVTFCEARAFEAIHLWTFEGLHAARHLYEEHGFVLTEERLGRRWGNDVQEQRFVKPIATST